MKNIAVIGSGTMGNGIAHVFAQHGYEVNMIDISEDALKNGINKINSNLDRQIKKEVITEEEKISILGRIKTTTDIKAGVQDCELVIEAATENLSIKLALFKDLDSFCPNNTILATNTSSISITTI
ncbi:MAG: 3-hydroxyacyl-CoA dehydrogenase NAD-binding domain-containing protein, partial [Cyclobacteriaceae bacterium]|nr:3-hydroxyacyl-CoA dehydrogenase NAD-binding domain-containing protein [Cyclobacteriaceae bacterium]